MNVEGRKEAEIEIKWDANRDPGQKFAAAVEFVHPERLNYSGSFLVAYPGRNVKGNFHFAIKGTFKVMILKTFIDGCYKNVWHLLLESLQTFVFI
jgi:hypothetical protein